MKTAIQALSDAVLLGDCKVPFVRSPYNYDRDLASCESGLCCEDLSLTQQHGRDDADINVIMARFGKTGQLPQGVRLPTYGDFEGPLDFQSALHAVMQAEDSFAAMSAKVRARFGNNPASFLDFCSDPANRAEAVSLGLVPPTPAASPAASPGPVSGPSGTVPVPPASLPV